MIAIKDTDGSLAFGRATYNAHLALQNKMSVTNDNFLEFDKDYHIHFLNEYGINITYQEPFTKLGHGRGAMTYEFANDKDLAWFMLKWS
jgi:hypothetical protein